MFAGDITDEPAVGMMGSVGVGILGVAIWSVLDTYCLAADTPSAILQAPDIVALGYSTKSARAATVGTTISSGAQLAIDFRRFLRRFLVAVNCVSSAFIARLAPRVSGECLVSHNRKAAAWYISERDSTDSFAESSRKWAVRAVTAATISLGLAARGI